MKNRIVVFLLFSVLIISCEDTSHNNVKACIDEKLGIYPSYCGDLYPVTVDEYSFQKEKVYVFEFSYCCCEYQSPVLASNCDTLGFLYGNTDNFIIKGEDFSNAEFLRTVWP